MNNLNVKEIRQIPLWEILLDRAIVASHDVVESCIEPKPVTIGMRAATIMSSWQRYDPRGCWDPIYGKYAKRMIIGSVIIWYAYKVQREVKLISHIGRKLREWSSCLLFWFSSRPNAHVRNEFLTSFCFNKASMRQGHSHPTAAAIRTGASFAITNFIAKLGCLEYSVSMSAKDKGDGSRLYYQAKDLDLAYRNDKITDNHIIKMVDVDYYCDVADYLWSMRPVIMYTFVPTTAGGSLVDGVFSIKDDVTHSIYNGGGTYEHKLWNYDTDVLIIPGIIHSLQVKVDSFVIPDDPMRRVICLTPTVKFLRVFERLLDKSPTLERRKFTFGGVNVVTTIEPVRDSVTSEIAMHTHTSLALQGSTDSVKIRTSDFIAIMGRLKTCAFPTVSEAERMLAGSPNRTTAAGILYYIWANNWDIAPTLESICPGSGRAKSKPKERPAYFNYQAAGPLLTEDGRPTGVAIAPPVLTGAGWMPVASYNNDVHTVEGRIVSVANRVEPRGYHRKIATDFINQFPIGEIIPLSISETIARMDKPLQRERSNRVKHFLYGTLYKVKSFMKREAYAKPTDPRNISTIPTEFTLRLNSFALAAKDKLHDIMPWFIPGSSPAEINQRIRELVRQTKDAAVGDFSRMDGHVSAYLREIVKAIMLRLFKSEYRAEITELLMMEVNATGTTATGVRYNTGTSTISGSPMTTFQNTLIAIFIVYGGLCNQTAAVPNIKTIPGAAAGDDVFAAGMDYQLIVDFATELGMKLNMITVEQGKPITFLARVWVDPWTSDSTIQDPVRALGKMHLSAVKNVPLNVVAKNKGLGYLASDSITPLISDYARYLVDVVGKDVTDLQLQQYKKQLEDDIPYWHREAGDCWIQKDYDIELMWNVLCEHLRCDRVGLRMLQQGINRAQWTPLEREVEVSIPCIIDGMLYLPPPQYADPPAEPAATQPATSQNVGAYTVRQRPNPRRSRSPRSRRNRRDANGVRAVNSQVARRNPVEPNPFRPRAAVGTPTVSESEQNGAALAALDSARSLSTLA